MTPVIAGTYGTWTLTYAVGLPNQTNNLTKTMTLTFDHTVKIPAGTSALWVKATQHDGQMAWSSPIYLKH